MTTTARTIRRATLRLREQLLAAHRQVAQRNGDHKDVYVAWHDLRRPVQYHTVIAAEKADELRAALERLTSAYRALCAAEDRRDNLSLRAARITGTVSVREIQAARAQLRLKRSRTQHDLDQLDAWVQYHQERRA